MIARKSRSHPGFTLIELLIVMLIIGILVAVIVPSVRAMMTAADVARTEENINTVQNAVVNYFTRNKAYPANIDATLTGASPPYLEKVVDDPFKTGATVSGVTTFEYATGTDTTGRPYYYLSSKGPDGADATSWNAGSNSVTTSGDDIYRTSHK